MRRLSIDGIIKMIMAVTVLCLVVTGMAFAQERLSVSASIANMRSGPGVNFDVLWQVEKYHPLIIIEKKGDWYKVKDFENDEAWLHESLLEKTEGVITIKDKCNVRSEPSDKSSILFTVEKGVPFKVLERRGSWINIEHADSDKGWIYKTLVW